MYGAEGGRSEDQDETGGMQIHRLPAAESAFDATTGGMPAKLDKRT